MSSLWFIRYRPTDCSRLAFTKLQSTPPMLPLASSPVLLKRMRSMAISSSLYSPMYR